VTGNRADGVWAVGAGYDGYVGRWSRLVAQKFVTWLDLPPGGRWLDVGCGTGALTATVLALAEARAVIGIDSSRGFLAHARAQVQDPRAAFVVGDAQAIPAATGNIDAAVSGLVLNFVPDPGRAVAEICRALTTGGTVGVYVWDYAGEMQMLRRFWDAASALDPRAAGLDEGRRFPLCQPEPLANLLRSAGLGRVETRAIDVPAVFRDFDDYWSPFLGGQGPAPGYVASLPPANHAALRERLRAALPVAPDGSIHLVARAWAVRGASV
jgi:SAM-dependent methyltransferase